MNTIDGIRPYGPGKFDLMIDAYIWDLSLDGYCDEEAGSISETGIWYGRINAGIQDFADSDLLNQDERDYLRSFVGAIVSEDSHGFVHVEYYASAGALRAAWREVEREVYELDWGADSDDCDEAQQDLFAD